MKDERSIARNRLLSTIVLTLLVLQAFIMPSTLATFGGGSESVETNTLQDSSQLGVEVGAPDPTRGENGDTVTHTFDVTNTGENDTVYNWDAESGHDWIANIAEPSDYHINAGETEEFVVYIQIPEDEKGHAMDQLTLEFWVKDDESISDSDHTYTYVGEISEVEVTLVPDQDLKTEPGESVSIAYQVKNTGNVEDTFDLESSVANDYWSSASTEDSVTLDILEDEVITVTARLPDITHSYEVREKNIFAGAAQDVVLKAETSSGYVGSASGTVEVKTVFSADIVFEEDEKSIGYYNRKEPTSFKAEVYNLCNIDYDDDKSEAKIHIANHTPNYILGFEDYEGDLPTWESFVSTSDVTLSGGESQEMMVEVVAPHNPLTGKAVTDFTVEPEKLDDDVSGSEYGNTRNTTVQVEKVGDVEVNNHTAEIEVTPSTAADVGYQITNRGNGVDSFTLTPSTKSGWGAEPLSETTKKLLPGESENVTVVYDVPLEVEGGHIETAMLESKSIYESQENENEIKDSDSVLLNTTTEYNVNVTIQPVYQEAEPNRWVQYEVIITNEGNIEDNISLSMTLENDEKMDAVLEKTSFHLEPWEEINTTLNARVSKEALYEEEYSIVITVSSDNDPNKRKSDTATISPSKHFELQTSFGGDVDVKPGETEIVDVDVRSLSNYEDDLSFNQDILHADWGVTPVDNRVFLDPGESKSIELEITAPALDGFETKQELEEAHILAGQKVDFRIYIYSSDASFNPHQTTYDVNVEAKERYEIEKTHNPSRIMPGERKDIPITLKNIGNVMTERSITVDDDHGGRYSGWTDIPIETHEIDVFDSSEFELRLKPDIDDTPYYNEGISLGVGVEGHAGNFTEINATVTSMVAQEDHLFGKIGDDVVYTLQVMNVPREKGVKDGDLYSNRIEDIDIDIPNRYGWNYTLDQDEISFAEAYEHQYIDLKLEIPSEDIVGEQEVTILTEGSRYNDSMTLTAEVGWFDLVPYVYNTNIGDNADTVHVQFQIDVDGYVPDNVEYGLNGYDIPPFELYINGEEVAYDDISKMSSPDDESGIFLFETVYTERESQWYALEQRYDIELVVNPDEEIHEVNPEGDEYRNNRVKESTTISRFTIPPNMMLISSLFSLILVAAFATKFKKVHSYSLLGIGIFLSASVVSLYMFPWYRVFHTETVNNIGLGLILFGTISLLSVSLIVPLYITDALKNTSKAAIPHEKAKRLKDIINEETMEEKPLYFNLKSLIYFGLSSINGFIGGFLFILLINIDRTHHFKDIMQFQLYGIPLIVFPIVFAMVSLGVSFLVLRRQEILWEETIKNKKRYEKIKEEASAFSMTPTKKEETQNGDDKE